MAVRSGLLGLAAVLLLGISGPSLARSSSPAARADTILIVKHDRTLYLLQDDHVLRSYHIALADEDLQDLWELTAGRTTVEILP